VSKKNNKVVIKQPKKIDFEEKNEKYKTKEKKQRKKMGFFFN
jgi:rRNA maturation protein Nop10